MVRQAASQTRFRALKHENGIAGRTTVIVKVIACFQPLQNCQCSYDCDLCIQVVSFGWMFTAKDRQMYQQVFAWNSSYLDRMAPLQHEQNFSLPYFSSIHTANVAFPGHYLSDFFRSNTSQLNVVGVLKQAVPPYCNISHPTGDLCDSQYALAVGKAIHVPCSPQKRFLILDQSGNHLRLFFSPSYSPQSQMLDSKIPASANDVWKEVTALVDQQLSLKPSVEENWDENHLIDCGDGEMREDTEEINALLYSDSDDEGDSDEVTSTGHSPFIPEDGWNKGNLQMDPTEEIASYDEFHKRQRLLNGKYKTPSSSISECSAKQPISHSYEDDVEASCAGDYNSYHDISSGKREKKVKIRQALKTLESIMPGLVSKDPLTVIDKAIIYLKSMKSEAEALGNTKRLKRL